jgi:hypothetical protein
VFSSFFHSEEYSINYLVKQKCLEKTSFTFVTKCVNTTHLISSTIDAV